MSRSGVNNRGGRPKGVKTPMTLKIEAAKQVLIDMYIANIKPINEALILKAKQGDMAAVKELHDRVYGRAMQPIEANVKGNLVVSFDPVFNGSSNTSQ